MADKGENVRVRIVEDVQRDLGERFHYVAYDVGSGQRVHSSGEFYSDRPSAAKAATKEFGKGAVVIGAEEVEDGLIDYPDSQYHKTLKEQEAVAKVQHG